MHMKPFHRSEEAGLIHSGRADRPKEEATRYVQHLAVDHRKLSQCVTLKQSDARPCIVLMHKFITKIVESFLTTMQTQERNAGERKDRIWVYPSVVLRFYKRWREDDAAQHIA